MRGDLDTCAVGVEGQAVGLCPPLHLFVIVVARSLHFTPIFLGLFLLLIDQRRLYRLVERGVLLPCDVADGKQRLTVTYRTHGGLPLAPGGLSGIRLLAVFLLHLNNCY